MSSPCTQVVLKVRKRVTLMVVAVSALFGICWPTDVILHLVNDVALHTLPPVVFSVIHTMIMINSAVNPFAYALINQRFREKMKGVLCCCEWRVHAAREPRDIELPDSTSHMYARQTCSTVVTSSSIDLQIARL